MSKHFSKFERKPKEPEHKTHVNKWGVVKESKKYLKGAKEKTAGEQPVEGQMGKEARQMPMTGSQAPEEWIKKAPLYLPHGAADRGKIWAEGVQPSEKAQMLQEHYKEFANHDLDALSRMVKGGHPTVQNQLATLKKRWVNGELLRKNR